VLSLKHDVSGYVNWGGRHIGFDNADGYIEKDWGEAFPESWVWMQCGDKEAAFVCSIAHIPYGLIKFTGLICVLLVNGKQYRFATYNGAKTVSINIRPGNTYVRIKRRELWLDVNVQNKEYGSLKAPTPGGMDRVISESLTARFNIKLYNRNGVIFFGSFENGGLEVYGAEEFATRF
jgi:hypothetical protein